MRETVGVGEERKQASTMCNKTREGERKARTKSLSNTSPLSRVPPAQPSLPSWLPSFPSPSLASPREGCFGDNPRGRESKRRSELGMWWGEDVREIGWEDIGSPQAVVAHEGRGEERKDVY